MDPVVSVVPRVGFPIHPDFLCMRCCRTAGALLGKVPFGIRISGEWRIFGKVGASGFVPSLCPHPPSKQSSSHFTIKAVSFPNSLGEKSVGKVALAADSDSNKRAARRSPKILQVPKSCRFSPNPLYRRVVYGGDDLCASPPHSVPFSASSALRVYH